MKAIRALLALPFLVVAGLMFGTGLLILVCAWGWAIFALLVAGERFDKRAD